MKLHFHFMKLTGTASHQGMTKRRAWPVPPATAPADGPDVRVTRATTSRNTPVDEP